MREKPYLIPFAERIKPTLTDSAELQSSVGSPRGIAPSADDACSLLSNKAAFLLNITSAKIPKRTTYIGGANGDFYKNN